jgi:hypothetical protein
MMRLVHFFDPGSHAPIEMVFPLAKPEGHQAVRTAIVAALLRMRPLAAPLAGKTTEGVTPYYLVFSNVVVQFLVIEVTELLANVQVTIVGKQNGPGPYEQFDETLLTPAILEEIAIVFGAIDLYVQDFLRKAYLLDELKPPPPPLDNHQALFYYQRIYFPHLDDNQFSQYVEVPLPTLRNWRHKVGMTQGQLRPVPFDWSLVRPDMTDEDFQEFLRRQKEQRRKRQEHERR